MREGRGQKPDDCLANHPKPRLHLLSVSRSKRENRDLWRHRIRKPKDPLHVLRCYYKSVLPARDLLPPHPGSLLQIHNVLWHPVLRRRVPVHHRILAHNDVPLLPYPLRMRPAASEAARGETFSCAKQNSAFCPGSSLTSRLLFLHSVPALTVSPSRLEAGRRMLALEIDGWIVRGLSFHCKAGCRGCR